MFKYRNTEMGVRLREITPWSFEVRARDHTTWVPSFDHPAHTEMEENMWARLRESRARAKARVTHPSPHIFLHFCMYCVPGTRGIPF